MYLSSFPECLWGRQTRGLLRDGESLLLEKGVWALALRAVLAEALPVSQVVTRV